MKKGNEFGICTGEWYSYHFRRERYYRVTLYLSLYLDGLQEEDSIATVRSPIKGICTVIHTDS